jgi:hypothetical protein
VLRPLFDGVEALLAETRPDHLVRFIVDSASRLLQCPYVSYYHAEKSDALELLRSKDNTTKVDPATVQEIVLKSDNSKIPLLINATGPADTVLQQKIIAAGIAAYTFNPSYELSGVLCRADWQRDAFRRDFEIARYIPCYRTRKRTSI